MANWFKEEINQLGNQLTDAIDVASGELQIIVNQAADKINDQRSLSSKDLQDLIDYGHLKVEKQLSQATNKLQMAMIGSALILGMSAIIVAFIIKY